MVVNEANINNIMSGIESTGGVRLHNHRRKLKQRFDIIKKLGQGTYGKVQLGINKETGQEVAIKTIKKCKIETEADLIRIRREIQIMSSVQHPNIIHIYEVFENREKMVLVMEYAAGGELYDYLSERKVLGEEEARRIFRQIAIAVYYCHKHKICHRDLKLENILLDENGNAKIADFGLSNVFDGQRLLSTFCGSPLYASPEIVKGTPYHGPEVDCWSLGVLLYTLVYGAMPFDGSNFKRLVKQISQGDYFEPKTPSPASSLIRDMLTVTPSKRADMEKICSHWWVNEGYDASCLDIAEHLANQTPVRLDLLLSLAPPPQVGSDKMVITSEENASETNGEEVLAPTRSMSTGSIVDRGTPQRKLRDTIVDSSIIESPKRKLEMTVSTDMANQSGVKRKERSRKKDRDSSSERRSGHRSSSRSKHTKSISTEDSNIKDTKVENLVNSEPLLSEQTTNLKSVETDKSKFVDLENEIIPEGAMCAELVEEANRKNSAIKRKSVKVKKTKTDNIINKTSDSNENKILMHDKNTNCSEIVNKENVENQNVSNDLKNDASIAKKIIKKKILADKNQIDSNTVCESNVEAPSVGNNMKEVPELHLDKKQNNVCGEDSVEKKMDSDENKNEEARAPTKQIERRRSKIFETAEKFQNLLSSTENKTGTSEKPKKIFIPGVNVGGFKQAFERKASLVSSIPPALKNTSSKKNLNTDSKQTIVNHEEIPKDSNQISNIATPTEKSFNDKSRKSIESEVIEVKKIELQQTHSGNSSPAAMPEDEERKLKLKNAVNIISNALDREGTRKSKSRPCVRKPPVPFGASGRSASGGIDNLISSPTLNGSDSKKIPKVQVGPNPTDIKTASVHVSTPEQTKYFIPEQDIENKTLLGDGTKVSTVEVNLKSATLPRRKTTKAEITLNYPQPKPASLEFKTEMQHRVEGHPKLTTQRSEVSFPVSAPQKIGFRSTSLEPESKLKPKERIIPISFEQETVENTTIQSPPTKPPTPRLFQTQRSVSQTQRVNSMSRQSTQDSDTDSTVSGQPEPIKKSPREYIIPIAVEGGGYVTPRAGSLEPSETSSTATSKTSRMPRFGRTRHMSSLLSDKDGSEDESPFATLHRHSSIGRDSDNEDAHRDAFHLHRLRSSRPSRKVTLEHTDSLSSGEEDDDEGFELLTAENLFSTLLSRVRSLTQRLNVEDSGRPGFPNSRLLSHFSHDNFWNFPNRNDSGRHLPFGRTFSRERDSSSSSIANSPHTPWRRSVSRELASDLEKAFGESQTLPRARVRVTVHVPTLGGASSRPTTDTNPPPS